MSIRPTARLLALFLLTLSCFGVSRLAAQRSSESASRSAGTRLSSRSSDAAQRSPARRERAQPGETAAATAMPARESKDTVELRNRKEFEQNSGEQPAKLLVRSASRKASVWIAGKSVGETPLLILLAPGQYKVELHGARMEHGQGDVALLPNESRELVLSMKQRYPADVELR